MSQPRFPEESTQVLPIIWDEAVAPPISGPVRATLRAGTPVYEQKQTTESNSTTSPLVDELIAPAPPE